MLEFYLAILVWFWNVLAKLHAPVKYESLVTGNSYTSRTEDKNGISQLYYVKQLKIIRSPRRPFFPRIQYIYEVTEMTYRDNRFEIGKTRSFPDLAGGLFRRTKIPHVLAINAFRNTNDPSEDDNE